MRKLFPYLTPSNIKSLFVSQGVSQGQFIHSGSSREYIEVEAGEIDLERFPHELYDSFGRLVKAGTGFPCLFICDLSGKIIWESSERAFEINTVERDILKHLHERTGSEIGEIKRLVAYPEGVTENPLDGVIRFGVVAPLSFGEELVGALCALNDREMPRSSKLNQQLKDAAALLVANLEANATSLQIRLENEALEEIHSFLRKGWGEAFLPMMCKQLAKIAEVEWAFVVNFDSLNNLEGQTVSAIFQGVSVENFTYGIRNSPLVGLKGPEIIIISEDAGEEFPDDTKMQEEEIESFAGIGLVNSKGKLSRALILMGRQPFKNEKIITKLLETVGPRAAAEIDGMRRHESDGIMTRVHEERFDCLFQNDAVGVMIIGSEGNIEAANSTLLENVQYSDQEITEIKHADLCAALDDETEADYIKACIDGERIGYQIKKTYYRSDQSTFSGLASVTMMPASEGEVVFLEVVRDLTDEQTAHDELQLLKNEFEQAESEKYSLFHSSPYALAKVNESGEILDANAVWLKTLSYGLPEIKGLNLAEVGADEGNQADIAKALAGRGNHETEVLTVRDKHEKPIRASFVFSPAGHDKNGVGNIMVALNDSTLQEEQSHLLQVTMEGIRSLSELPGVALAWLDDKAGFIRTSLEIEKVLNLKMPELGGMTLFDVMPDEEEDVVRAGLDSVASGQLKVFQWKCDVVHSEELVVHVQFSVMQVPDQGNREFYLLVCKNQTDEKLFEQEALIREEQLNGIVEGVGLGVLFVDLKGKLLRANRVAASMLGRNEEQMKGTSLYDWIADEDQQRIKQRIEVSELGRQFSFDLEVQGAEQHIPVKLAGRSVASFSGTADPIWILFLTDQAELQNQTQEISELSQKLTALELHSEALHSIQNTGICIVQANGMVSDANSYLESKLDFAVTDNKYQLSDLIDVGEQQEVLMQRVGDCLSGKRDLFDWHGKLNRSDQEEVWMELCFHPVKADDGEVLYLVAAWQDRSKLVESEDRWQGVDAPVRELINSSHAGLVFLDNNLTVTNVNSAMSRILNVSIEKVNGRKITEFIAPEDKAIGLACIKKAESNGSLRFIGRAGEARHTRVTVQKFGTGKRGDKYWFLMLVKLQEVEAKLEAEAIRWRRRFETLFDRKDVPMGICDAKGQLLEVNQGLIQLTGLEREALKYKAWSDYMVDQKWELPASIGGDPVRFDSVFNFDGKREMNGRLFVQESMAGGDGTGLHYAWLLQDVSEEIQAKEWGKLRDVRLKAFLANPVVGLAVLDRTGQVVEANKIFEEFFGQKPEVFIGKDIKQYLRESDRESFTSEWASLVEGGHSRFQFSAPIEVINEDVPVEEEPQVKLSRLTVVLLDGEESTGFAVVLLEDLTELKETRESLEQTHLQLEAMEQQKVSQEEQMTHELEIKTNDYNESKRQLQEKCAEYEGVAGDLEALVIAHQNLKEVSTEQEKRESDLSGKLEEVESRAEALKQELADKARQCQEHEEELEVLIGKQEDLQNEISSRKVDFDHLNVVKHELEEKIVAQSKLFTEKEEARKRLEERLKAASDKCKAREEEISEFKLKVKTYEAEKSPSLSEVVSDSEVAVVVISDKRLIQEENQAFRELIEFSGDELHGQKLDEIFGLTLDEEQEGIIQNVFDGKAANFHMEVPVMMKDLAYRWLRINGSKINQEKHEQQECVLIVEDVTPQYDAENQLGIVEQRFLALAENGSIGVLMADAEGTIFFSNPTLVQLLGSNEEELIGKTLNDFVHEDDPKEDLQLDERCLQGEIDDYQIEKMLITAAGKILWARINVKVIRFEDGGFWYTIRTVEDLTGLHEAAEKLTRTEGRLGKIFQASDAALVLMDRHSNVVELSAGACKLFGSDSKDIIRKKLDDMGEVGTEQRFGNLFGMLEGGQVKQIRVENEIVTADGDRVQVLAVLHAVLDEDEKFESAVASIQEITLGKNPEQGVPEEKDKLDIPEIDDDTETSDQSEVIVSSANVERGKTEIIPQVPKVIKSPEKTSTRTQALKDSVKISESQKIDTSKINVPKPPQLQKEHLRHSTSLNEGWILADDSGRVVLINRWATEFLGMEREQALLKPLAEILHMKEQKSLHVAPSGMDEEVMEADINESVIVDYHQETLTVIQMSKPVKDAAGEITGTVVLFLPIEKLKELPGYNEKQVTDSHKKCAKAFLQSVAKLQEWVTDEMEDYLPKCLRLTPSDLAVEAVAIEEKLKK